MEKQFITPTGIITVHQIAEPTGYPQVQKQFKPKTHVNDRVRAKIAKRHVPQHFTGSVNSFSALKALMAVAK